MPVLRQLSFASYAGDDDDVFQIRESVTVRRPPGDVTLNSMLEAQDSLFLWHSARAMLACVLAFLTGEPAGSPQIQAEPGDFPSGVRVVTLLESLDDAGGLTLLQWADLLRCLDPAGHAPGWNPPASPTAAPPGSAEKLDVLAGRASRGEALFHSGDALWADVASAGERRRLTRVEFAAGLELLEPSRAWERRARRPRVLRLHQGR